MPRSYPNTLDVQVINTQTKDASISAAVEELIPEAIRSRTGISVTRCAINHFRVAVDLSVPCGEIHERDRV